MRWRKCTDKQPEFYYARDSGVRDWLKMLFVYRRLRFLTSFCFEIATLTVNFNHLHGNLGTNR
ncbi:MAG: hypothetical protein DU481_00340 [Nitrosomonas sp.]